MNLLSSSIVIHKPQFCLPKSQKASVPLRSAFRRLAFFQVKGLFLQDDFSLASCYCSHCSPRLSCSSFQSCAWVRERDSDGEDRRKEKKQQQPRDRQTREQRGPCKAAEVFPAIVSSLEAQRAFAPPPHPTPLLPCML